MSLLINLGLWAIGIFIGLPVLISLIVGVASMILYLINKLYRLIIPEKSIIDEMAMIKNSKEEKITTNDVVSKKQVTIKGLFQAFIFIVIVNILLAFFVL